MEFTHLHVHSHYSLLDGANRIKDLVKRAKELGMSSLALTDHGNLFGAVDFYQAAHAEGLKPILGMEAYLSPTRRDDRSMGQRGDAYSHLLLLAQNETGWRNLMRLSSRAYLEGFYYKPRIDRELLAQNAEGLICTTACIGGDVPQAFLRGRPEDARRLAGEYLDIFGRDRFFIEVQNQGEADQERVNPQLVQLARDLGVGLVGTNDVHFLHREDKAAHEVLTCISTQKLLGAEDAMKYSAELYLKSPQEMCQALSAFDGAAANTLKIAEMCDFRFDLSRKHLPVFRTPDGSTPEDYLDRLAWEGLAKRFKGQPPPDAYRDRMVRELDVIRSKGYSSYFLIVWDFVDFARRHQIPAAPRGSGVATLLGYALGIADVDPLRYGLLFERFTDPQRQEDPDIDIDICQEGRERVLQYVREKYVHVAQIITYGTLKPRAAIRDVGRVLGIPIPEVNLLTKRVPDDVGMTLEKALAQDGDFRRLYEDDGRTRQWLDYCKTLEGLARHAGVHAAGVVVADEALEDLIPLCRQPDSPDAVITQWDGPTCEKAGMMKMDFLGLRTLTILQRARELVRAQTGQDVDPEEVPLDDPEVYALFRRGETDGVFQFESEGMKGVLKQMQPNRIEDLIAANAMYRPGPMDLIDSYCQRKRGDAPVAPVHELVDDLLAETYGIMTYQEQVMQVLNKLGGLPLGRALTLIKAISKKKHKVIDAERSSFIEGALANGIAEKKANELFDLILKFAGYGFNKAHSTRYAIVAYQTAYFKTHYPRHFWAATLTYECADQDKVVAYMTDARRMGIIIAAPDINTCDRDFTIDGDNVRFGLTAIKGVGSAAVEAIVKERTENGPFQSLHDFCRRVDTRAVNRSTIEALIKCGAFDQCGGAHRAAMVAGIEQAMQAAQAATRDRLAGQMSLFGAGAEAADAATVFPDVKPWSRDEKLASEKETLGFYVSAHPLDAYGPELRGLNWPAGFNLAAADGTAGDQLVCVGAMVSSLRTILTKKGRSAGKKMAILSIEDLQGRSEAVLFAEDFEKAAELVKPDAMLFFTCQVDHSRERTNLIVKKVISLDKAIEEAPAALRLRLSAADLADQERLAGLQALIKRHPGSCPVRFQVEVDDSRCQHFTVDAGRTWRVRTNAELSRDLKRHLGLHNMGYLPTEPSLGDADRGRFRRRG